MINCLMIMTGLPGTGKTTLVDKIFPYLDNYILISQNEIRRDMGIKKMPKTQDAVIRKIDVLTANLLNQNKNVLIDSAHTPSSRRQQLYGVASCCEAKVITLECVCSEKEAKRRIRPRPKSDGLISDPNNPDVYDKLLQRWEGIQEYDFKHAGQDHVSHIIFDSEKKQFYKKIISKGMGEYVNKIKKIILENS